MLKDIGEAKESVEMYARVYISNLIKNTGEFVSAIIKAIDSSQCKNGLRIRHVSTNYSDKSLVEMLWNLESPTPRIWTTKEKYKEHLKTSDAYFESIKKHFSTNKHSPKDVIFERAYLTRKYPLPFSILSIDDKTIYVSFYDMGVKPNFGTFAPTIRLVSKKTARIETWADLFLKYKQDIDEKFLSKIEKITV